MGQPVTPEFLEAVHRTRDDECGALRRWASEIGLDYDFRHFGDSVAMTNATGCTTQTSSPPTGTTDDHTSESDDWG
jgi:hypothetical protein